MLLNFRRCFKIRKNEEDYSYEGYKKEVKGLSKLKIGFFQAPDKMEKYIEEMEMKGYRIQSISSYGPVLNFRKGEPRRVKCCVDIQIKVNDEYYQLYREAGWRLVYRLNDLFCKYIIWIKEYKEGEEKPHIYSDYESQVKEAKLLLFANAIFVPVLIFMVLPSLLHAIILTDIYGTIPYLILISIYAIDLWNNARYFINIRKLKVKQIKI